MSRKDLKKIMGNNEQAIMDYRQVREEYIGRVEVLERVKKLFTIPNLDCMLLKQVADYYEVSIDSVKGIYNYNKEEFIADGAIKHSIKDVKSLMGENSPIKNIITCRGGIEIPIDENTKVFIPNTGVILFPKRAILRVGMLLRDSVIAKEVRTQLLNIVEVAQEEKPEIITQEIQKEEDLLLNISKAFATGNVMKLMTAMQEYSSYKDRHIKRLENDKKLLTADILTISDRQMFNAVMRKLVYTLHIDYPIAFGIFYKQLNYKYGINLKARGDRKPPYIRNVREDEWDKVQKSIVAILEDNHINATEFLESCKPTNALKSQNH